MKRLNVKEIEAIIPHRHPFLLIDYIEDYEPGKYAVGYKCVSYREEFSARTGDAGSIDRGGAGAGRSCSYFEHGGKSR